VLYQAEPRPDDKPEHSSTEKSAVFQALHGIRSVWYFPNASGIGGMNLVLVKVPSTPEKNKNIKGVSKPFQSSGTFREQWG
jgi:hypothetical protein